MKLHSHRDRLEAGIALFRRLVEEHPQLCSEFEGSRGDFHGDPAPPDLEGQDALAQRRRLEWFLFERVRAGELAVDVLLVDWQRAADEGLSARLATFVESWTGIFEVESAAQEGELLARDLGGLTPVRIDLATTGAAVQIGDLLVGRAFPLGDGSHGLSPAAGHFRSPELSRALRRDLERLRQLGSKTIVRLSQIELERMFFSDAKLDVGSPPSGGGGEADAVGDFERFLLDHGFKPLEIAIWMRALGNTPLPVEVIAPAVGDAAGAILDQLAFHSDVDLETARALILRAWPALTERGDAHEPAGETEAHERTTVLAFLQECDRDRAAGLGMEESFRELERRLGLDLDDGDEETRAPDFPGVVGAMVEEFLWETERMVGVEQRLAHEGLRAFGAYTERVGVFENLSAREFLSFAAFWLPESRRLTSGAEAERMIAALHAFGAWAAENQGLDELRGSLDGRLSSLSRNLPRVVVANALLPKAPEVTGELFEYRGRRTRGRALVRDVSGEEREVQLEGRLLSLLEEGDLFRGHTSQDGEFVVSCCYPPEAAELRQSFG